MTLCTSRVLLGEENWEQQRVWVLARFLLPLLTHPNKQKMAARVFCALHGPISAAFARRSFQVRVSPLNDISVDDLCEVIAAVVEASPLRIDLTLSDGRVLSNDILEREGFATVFLHNSKTTPLQVRIRTTTSLDLASDEDADEQADIGRNDAAESQLLLSDGYITLGAAL